MSTNYEITGPALAHNFAPLRIKVSTSLARVRLVAERELYTPDEIERARALVAEYADRIVETVCSGVRHGDVLGTSGALELRHG